MHMPTNEVGAAFPREVKSAWVWGTTARRDPPNDLLGGISVQTERLPHEIPQHSLERLKPGLSGDKEGIPGPPPAPRPAKVQAASRAGNPARAPNRGAAAGKSGENFCFFFFSGTRGLPPRSLLPALAPTWGILAQRSAPSTAAANRSACCSGLCFSANRREE